MKNMKKVILRQRQIGLDEKVNYEIDRIRRYKIIIKYKKYDGKGYYKIDKMIEYEKGNYKIDKIRR